MGWLARRSRTWLLQHVLLPLGDLAFGQKMMRRLRFLEEAQWWDRERLHAHRDRELAKLIRISYHEVPFYRRLMDERHLTPDDIRTTADIHKLPIVGKPELRAAYPHSITRETGQKTVEHLTSGSTGSPFVVLKDAETIGWYRATLLMMLRWAGWDFGEPHFQIGLSLDRSLDRRIKDRVLKCHYMATTALRDDQLDHSLQVIEKHKLEHLSGYPGYLYCLARRAMEQGWNRPMRSIVTWGENVPDFYRRTIEQAFGVRVFDTYGCAEGIQIAGQCGHGTHYHEHPLDCVVEYLDQDGSPVPRGQAGTVVLTRLHAGPMPLVRYRLADLAIQGEQGPCPCGRGSDLMASIEGRLTDIIFTPDGTRVIGAAVLGALLHFPEIDTFQIVQEQLDEVLLRLKPRKELTKQLLDGVREELRETGLVGVRINVEMVDDIPLTAGGKQRFVISKLEQQH